MSNINRRNLIKMAALAGVALGGNLASGKNAFAGTIDLAKGGKDFSPSTGAQREKIATACWSCVTRDPMVGYVENGRLVKLEGNPDSVRTNGKICAKGQAGVNQVYDPDRILHPLKRVGKRGDGKWKKISWDEALTEISGRLKKLRDAGTPEKFMFHYGRMKSSNSKMIKSVFLSTYGTKTIGNHTSICEGAKWVGQELTWGKHYDNWDFDKTKYILNFGSAVLESHTNHIPMSQRFMKARVDRGVKAVTFDVRLSNTAAKSDEWIPINPGTDGAVALAMCNEVMQNNWYDKSFLEYVKATANIDDTVDTKAATLKKHFAQYTAEWAEKVSGVPASTIKRVVKEFATAKPAVVISYRGAVAHYNGSENERAIQTLAALTGNIDNPGGRCRAVAPKWKYHKGPKDKPKAKALKILKGFKGDIAYATHGANHQVFKMIKDGSAGRPEVYMWYCYSPVYSNCDCKENVEVLKDEKLIPFSVCVNPFYDEAAALADIILPDVTYLEKWDWEDGVGPDQIAEYYTRQPLVKPLGEARDFCDVVCDLADRMGMPLGFGSKKEFVQYSCEHTPGVKEAGGFDYMMKHGIWRDKKAKGKYFGYKAEVSPKKLKADGVVLDEATGTYWNWKKAHAKGPDEGYTTTKNAYKGYVGQKVGGKVVKGFKPDKLNKSGYFEIYSGFMEAKGHNPLPSYIPIPEHQSKKSNQLILTTYKVPVQIHSRSANCKWLTEIYHENPAKINPSTAKSMGISDGDKIKVSSNINNITTTANVTDEVIPGVVAISFHCGHWEYGRYASGKKSPMAGDNDPDLKLKWWKGNGAHPNWVIPNWPDPISGQQRTMDQLVNVSKA